MRSLDEIKEEYNKRVSFNEQELQKIAGRIRLIVFLRFALFALVVATVVYAWERPAMFFLAAIFLFLFIRIVVLHKKLAHKRDFSLKCVKVYSEELGALEYDFSAFDDGAEFVDSAHPYTYDLDVFGGVSLFRSLNRCATVAGRTMLAGWLKNHLVEREVVVERQRCVRELMSEHDFRCNLRVLGLLYDGVVTDVSKIGACCHFLI